MTEIAGTQLISRTCQILHSFNKATPELSLAAISKKCSLPPATAFRILQALVIEGFVIQDPISTNYRLGYGLVSIGELAKLSNSLLKIVRPFAEELNKITGEYVTLEKLNRNMWVDTLDFVPTSNYRLNIQPSRDLSLPAHCTATGKVQLAYLPEERIDTLLSRKLEKLTPYSITDPKKLKEHLAVIRQQGYAISQQELEIGFVAIAAPIFELNREVVAAISVGAPDIRFTNERVESLIPELTRIATSISAMLGYVNSSK